MSFGKSKCPASQELLRQWSNHCRITRDTSPMPPQASTPEEDEALFDKEPWIDGPINKLDYGYNVKFELPAKPEVSLS